MIDLIIGGSWSVDLPEKGISILFQKQRTDYTNPTIVRNSFTKTINLPGTKTNNDIFCQLWKLDRYVKQGKDTFVPSERVPFILLQDGNLTEMGYVKLNNIIWDGYFYTYQITLYGELGNLLYELSYNIDEETNEVSPLTLGDLDYGFTQFRINKELVENAWKRLDGDSSVAGNEYRMFDTINFMVSYDGIPQADNFDPKDVWCSVDRKACGYWKDRYFYANQFPSEFVDDNVTYKFVSTMVSKTDPDDHYGLMTLPKEVSYLESRDLRSYLLRPVIRVKKIFEAIGRYIASRYGYSIDMSDPFFSTEEFTGSWMTLSMLYEIDPAVETGTLFTKEKLLKDTSSPASYLISYCKIYGIYMDVDYFHKELRLTRMPDFFDDKKVRNLKIDAGKEIRITPLSFDKASYTFDYGDGESEFLKKYKETYGIKYGSKRVNTGYRFDASTAPYIDNNIFRQGVDSIDQSIYYRYPYAVGSRTGEGDVLFTYPFALVDEANLPTYKLFNRDSGQVKTTEGEMRPWWYPATNISDVIKVYDIRNSGYQFMNVWWGGLRPQIWQDGFPKLQCHSEDNKAADGKNILVRFGGFKESQYGHLTTTEDKTFWNRETYSDDSITATNVNYLLSDDYPYLKEILGHNCYYDNPSPSDSYGGYSYIKTITRLPSFTRAIYDYNIDSNMIPVFYVGNFNQYNIVGNTSNVTVTKHNSYYTTNANGTGRQYSYAGINNIYKNHRYFVAASVKTENASSIRKDNQYARPDIIGCTLIDSNNLQLTDRVQLIGSIVKSEKDSILEPVCSLSTYNTGSWDTQYLVVYDLTEMGMDNVLTTVDKAIQYFGMTEKTIGYTYNLEDTVDFGISRELYVPACSYEKEIGVYNKYWKRYIADVYSINTRVMECYCYLDNISDVFREFYYYDNCLWVLSKITDWSMVTKRCKATLIKVNDIHNYVS